MSAAQKIPDSQPESQQALVEILKKVNLLSDIKEKNDALHALAAIMSTRYYKAGENILTEGTSGTELFILVMGQASVYKSTPQGDEYKVAIFDGAKNIAFGESGLIEADARSATIRADIESTCIALDRLVFEKFSTDHPEWALPIYRRIATAVMGRLKKTNTDMLLLYNALVAEIRGQ